ncbi:hypothetical protein BASA81_008703 [Batrachochytrium salamandrivorans]|nr:hypothetical protein BASA81_008703 [Batrachochytrium salamandrivorans]
MEQSTTPLKAKKTPTKPKASLLSQVDPCYVCKKKGGNQTCKTCTHKVCMDCIHEETKECNTCEFEHNIFKSKTRGKPQYADQFKASVASTPNPNTPQQAKTPGRVTQLIYSAVRLFSNKKEDSMAMTPVQPSFAVSAVAPGSAAVAAAAPPSPTTQKLVKQLKAELKNVNALNAQLQSKLDEKSEQLAKQDAAATGNQTMMGQTFVEVKDQSSSEEDRMQIVDLRIQLSEATTNIRRLETELLFALEREQDLMDKNAKLTQVLQNHRTRSVAGSSSASSSGRSAIPPCPPLPKTRESEEWKALVKAGKEHPASAWLLGLSSESPATEAEMDELSASLTFGLDLNAATANGKKRSEIPAPPPLPAGMTVAPGKLAGLRLSMRRSSAPGLLETVSHQQQRRPCGFTLSGEAKPDLKPLYWSALDEDRSKGTIFEMQDALKVRPEKMKKELLMLDTRFAKKPKASTGKPATTLEIAAAPVSTVSIMDGKRTQQLGIVLNGGFRNVDSKTLRKAITGLDRAVLNEQRVKVLLEIIPTNEEIKHIEDLQSGNMLDAAFFARITKEEQFFLDMAAIKRVRSRLQCLAIVMQLGPNMEQLVKDCELYVLAVSTVRTADKWKQFLHLCLETGNYLNSSNANLSGAYGFKLKEGLNKLVETKSCENNSTYTLMHWIAKLASEHYPELFQLESDFSVVNEASALSVSEIQKDLAAYSKQLDLVCEEVKHCGKINPEDPAHAAILSSMGPFAEQMTAALDLLKQQVEAMVKDSQGLVAMHGEDPKVDTCNELFKTILGGVVSFLKCRDDNVAHLLREQTAEKATGPNAPKSASKSSSAAATATTGRHGASRPQESVIAQDSEFKMKMERQQSKRGAA